MKNLTLKIYSDFISDSYIYMGRLFILTKDKEFLYIMNTDFFNKYLKSSKKEFDKQLYRILFNNRLLSPKSFYLYDENYSTQFDKYWQNKSNKDIEVELKRDDLTFLCNSPSYPILDFKIYGQKAIVANRVGLFEVKLELDQKKTNIKSGFIRIFDSKSISINTRLGEVLITTKKDGLFRGSLWTGNKIKVYKRPIHKSSTKSSWTKYNFINYEDQLNSRLFLNEIVDLNIDMPNFLREDRFGKPKKISKFGETNIDLFKTLKSKINKENVVFNFNSLSYYFLVSKQGEISYLKVDDSDNLDYSKTSVGNYFRKLPIKISRSYGKPISALTIKNGIIFEFYDKVVQYRKGKSQKVYSNQIIEMKSYPSSIRYKSIVQFNVEDGLILQSLYPYI